jgi:hypothetical protein
MFELGLAAMGKKALLWIGELDLIHIVALVLGIVCLWQFVTLHGLAFEVIPGLKFTRIHIVSMQGKVDAARADAADARKNLAISIGNEAKLRGTVADQNKRISDLGVQSAQQQAAGQKARKAAETRAQAAEAARDRLRRSAATKPKGPNCEPSETLKRQWS